MIRPAVYLRLAAGLTALVLAEAAAVGLGAGEPPVAIRPIQPPAAPAQRAVGLDVQAMVDDVLARPVFSPSRRPVPPSAAPLAEAGPSGLPRLTGILVGDHVRTAIFAAGADGKPVIVGERGKVAGWEVQSIDADHATLLGPAGPQVVRPSFDGAASAATPPSTLPPGAPPPGTPPPGPGLLDALRRTAPRPGGINLQRD